MISVERLEGKSMFMYKDRYTITTLSISLNCMTQKNYYCLRSLVGRQVNCKTWK